jgi:hypothetical protein
MERIRMDTNMSNLIICPVCKGTNLSTQSEGMIFNKKNVLTCNNCHTVLEQSGKGDYTQFKVRKVGAEYSNADRLFTGKAFTIQKLRSHELPIVPDALLEEYANGNLEGLSIKMKGDLNTEIFLKKDENIVLWMGPIDYLEERRRRGSGGAGSFSIRIAKGLWYRTSQMYSGSADELAKLDSGILVITNRRYIFKGMTKNIDQLLNSLSSINPFSDGISIVRSGKQKTEFFRGDYHWPLISSIIIGLVKNANEQS